MSSSNRPLLSSVFGGGSVYEELDQEDKHVAATRHHTPQHYDDIDYPGEVQSGALATLESDDEDDEDGLTTNANRQTESGVLGPPQRPRIRRPTDGEDGLADDNDEVPVSVLMESPKSKHGKHVHPTSTHLSSTFRPTTLEGRQRLALHHATNNTAQDPPKHGIGGAERALWMWANVENLDNFLVDVYAYYEASGFYSMLLSRFLNILTLMFVVWVSTYITSCVDYSKIKNGTKLSDIQIDRCMSKLGLLHTAILWLFAGFCFMKVFQYAMDVRRLVEMKNFYHHLLEIPESDMQTVSWQHVVNRIVLLRDQNLVTATQHRAGDQSKKRLDLCDVANRIMRQDNYFIAMINKDVLDLSIPLPGFRDVQFLTKTMEWHLNLCIMDFAFNKEGQLRPVFLKGSHRTLLAEGLKRRFVFAGIMNIVVAPFGIIYLTLLYFFQYYGEYHKNPSSIGSRQYTPLAEWKFREFNELEHLFRRRMRLSYEPAAKYINQFPKEKTASLARFISFVAGSFAAILGIATLLGPEQFLGLEITKDRTVLFYIGVFTTILAVSRGMIPEETLVFDPEPLIREVAEHTHYLPEQWHGKLHSDSVKSEFSTLYQYKLLIILREVASVVIAPFVLWYSLPKSAEKIVDFFRDFSVHVDGLGYVCSFALFDFEKTSQSDPRGAYFNTNDGKMLKSYLNFMDNYGVMQRQKTQGQQEHQEDLQTSVMGRFSEYNDGGHVPVPPTGTTISSRAKTRAPQTPAEPGYEMQMGDYDGTPGNNADDGGVLGLLNQFYKQAGAGEAHRI